MNSVSLVGGPRLHLAQRLREVAANTPVADFGIVLGLSGLGGAWRAAALAWHMSALVGETVYALAGAVWVVLIVLYAFKAVLAPDKLAAEAVDAVQCCFIGLAGVATMLVAGGLIPYSAGAATVLFGLGVLFTLGFVVWRTGGLWQGGRDYVATTAVQYLPTVAGSFVSATVGAVLGLTDWGQLAFGAGLFSWLAMESVLLHRLLTGTEKPVALRPTLGIQLAPAPVGAMAYLSVGGGAPDLFAHALIGYGLLQVLV
ncbi:Tellurite resistance protein TehA [Methylobacterium hispanicum]|jgi:tellurite resistance protein|uniref:Tellurite resistance protein TehA n=1 Tax=Methylobacterium hispanicum TaxID=270350 RepID=A0AAV4ZUI0_9HYPH|nr:dicarboxylate transporter/tellurite-resistance protein TehA [Methylobacterium hispanicum]GJD92167.1 Tellurite resistance protein TehA [Methylobacterium hispanicum]